MKNIIITGAKGNLGKAVVTKFMENDYRVFGTISEKETTHNDINNSNLEFHMVDLMDTSSSAKFVDLVIDKNKSIEGAVLTVGGFKPGKITDTTKDDFEKMFALNFTTALNIVQPLLKQMLSQKAGGRIVLIGAKPGMLAGEAKNAVAYGLSKSLLFRLAEVINQEGKAKNVFAHIIVPGTIDTPQNRAAMPDANFNNWVKAEEIANLIAFIFSGEATALRDPVIEITGNA